jgi:CDP-diacylglycerol---glycerol-3-phosphate 3-phosphatidyltransferase
VQIIAIAVLIAPLGNAWQSLGTSLFWLAVGLTWISGLLYLWPRQSAT